MQIFYIRIIIKVCFFVRFLHRSACLLLLFLPLKLYLRGTFGLSPLFSLFLLLIFNLFREVIGIKARQTRRGKMMRDRPGQRNRFAYGRFFYLSTRFFICHGFYIIYKCIAFATRMIFGSVLLLRSFCCFNSRQTI